MVKENQHNFWEDSSKRLLEFINKPEKFLTPQPAVAEKVRCMTKEFYDTAKSTETAKDSREALPELIIEHFDDEQVWQQLELQNSDSYDSLVQKVSHLMAKKKAARVIKKMEAAEEVEEENDDEENQQKTKKKSKKKNIERTKGPVKESVVDDKFFKLQQMEEFLLKEEKEKGDGSGDDESIDLFADDSDDENEAEEDGAQYKDFFDAPEGEQAEPVNGDESDEEVDDEAGSGEEEASDDFSNGEEDNVGLEEEEEESVHEEEENEEGQEEEAEENDDGAEESEEEESTPIQKTNKKSLLDDGNESEEEDDEDKKELPKSSYEQRQERLEKKIERIHDEALGAKPWQLLGEISATTRPQNSLLEEVLQFDRTTRPAPVITEQTTIKLEDIIKQRAKDKVWDDVERKVKPVEEPVEYKKRLTLDQSKSKISLAEIYEQDYLKQKDKADPTNGDDEEEEKETPEQTEIKKLMHNLFTKLDALSNYHYTPKPAAPDVKVITNLPAITVEEVAPVTSSDAALLAPEEVKGKLRGNEIGKEERTVTDKKRERRKKKSHQRAKKKARDAKEIAGGGTKAAVKRAIKEGKVKELEVNDRNAVKSSTTFFNRLQDEVTSSVSLKKQEMKRKKSQENRMPAKKLKL